MGDVFWTNLPECAVVYVNFLLCIVEYLQYENWFWLEKWNKCKDYVHWVRHKKTQEGRTRGRWVLRRQLDKSHEILASGFHHEDVRWKLTSHCSNEGKEPIGKCSTIFDRLWAKNLSILCSFAHHQATASQRKIIKLSSADLMNRVHEIDIKGSPTKKHTK